jgi:hypothetical protein
MNWDYKYQGRPIGPLNKPQENWHMGDALTYGMSLQRGTVVATFDRNQRKYLNEPRGNHTAIFLEWGERDNRVRLLGRTVWGSIERGMWVIEQGPDWPPQKRFILFDSTKVYHSDAGRFNVVLICEPLPSNKKR